MNNNISTIITIYKTPLEKLYNLRQYKNFNLILFEQNSNFNSKKKIKKILNFKFKYFFSKKNIGLTKSSNFLLRKVKTKYVLFTQADIILNPEIILKLKKILYKNHNLIFITPNLHNKKKKKKDFSLAKKVQAACMLCDVKKIKEIGFFDEDFFLYWEDIDLMKRINNSKFKMGIANNIYAKHLSSQSSENSLRTLFLRSSNFTYGEFVYDFKYKRLRLLKITRKIIKNLFLFLLHIIIFKFKKSFINLSIIYGVLKFILYYLKK